jgi:hypothetical protein
MIPVMTTVYIGEATEPIHLFNKCQISWHCGNDFYLYSGNPWFESQLRLIGVFMVFLSPSRQMSGQCFNSVRTTSFQILSKSSLLYHSSIQHVK